MVHDGKKNSIATPIMATLFILVAAITFWDTTGYTDPDSYVFPLSIAVVMTGLSIILILRWMIMPLPETTFSQASNLRRIGLIAVMFTAALAMPWFGFILSGLLAYAAIVLLAMYDSWTRKRACIYTIAGTGVVVGLFLLFKIILKVPLPTGIFFGG